MDNRIPLSQRDPRWKDILLGYSKTATIGSDGCFITSIAYILKADPVIVNQRLKEVGGFVKDTGNLIWDKIPVAFHGITITHLLHIYDNDVVKNNLPAFITVNGAPIGAPLHAVVYVGNQKLMDPWTGNIEATSKYAPLKFVVFKGEWKMESIGELKVKVETLQKQVLDLQETEKRLIKEKDEVIKDLEDQAKTCQTMISNTRNATIGEVQNVIDKLKK